MDKINIELTCEELERIVIHLSNRLSQVYNPSIEDISLLDRLSLILSNN